MSGLMVEEDTVVATGMRMRIRMRKNKPDVLEGWKHRPDDDDGGGG